MEGKKQVFQTSLGTTDLKDYVVGKGFDPDRQWIPEALATPISKAEKAIDGNNAVAIGAASRGLSVPINKADSQEQKAENLADAVAQIKTAATATPDDTPLVDSRLSKYGESLIPMASESKWHANGLLNNTHAATIAVGKALAGRPMGESSKATVRAILGFADGGVVPGDKANASSEFERGKNMMGEGIDELIALLGGKTNMLPEEEAKIIPVMSKIFRGAAIMGYVKFEDAARFVINTLRGKSKEVSDKLSIDNLQAGYINIASEIGGNKKEALSFDSIEQLMAGNAATPAPAAGQSVKQMQDEEKSLPHFSPERSAVRDRLKAAVTSETKATLDAYEMPVFRTRGGMIISLHPSSSSPGMIQVTRYNDTGAIGDSQYATVEQAITEDQLHFATRLTNAEAETVLGKIAEAEQEYQAKRKAYEDQLQAKKDAEKAANAAKFAATQRRAQRSTLTPTQRRDDLIGAIMRVTGGRGIHPNMADTLVGDTANNATKLRGLFTRDGQQDMDDLAMLLREPNEGYDVADGEALSAMIREAAAGDMTTSMTRQVQDMEDAKEKEHRARIRAQAKKYGIKTEFVEFSELEKRVFETQTKRHDEAVKMLDDRSKGRYDAALARAEELKIDYAIVETVMMDVQGRGLRAIPFWNETTRLLRGIIADAEQKILDDEQKAENDRINNAPEGADPYAEEGGDGRGNSPVGGGAVANQPNPEAAPGFSLEQQTLAEVNQQEANRVAEEAAKASEAAKEAADKRASEKLSLEEAIKARAANSDNFQFGEGSKEAAKPMGGLFDQPPVAAPTPKERLSSDQWRDEGMTPAQIMARKAAIEASELAGQIQQDAEEADFDPKDSVIAAKQWAKDAGIPEDVMLSALRDAVEKLPNFRRKAGTLAAMNKPDAPALSPLQASIAKNKQDKIDRDAKAEALKAERKAKFEATKERNRAANDDLRGYAYAIVKNGQILTSGSFPSPQNMPNGEDAKLAKWKAEAERLGGDLYVGGYPGATGWKPQEGLIFGMTFAELNANQQRLNVPASLKGKMPADAVLAFDGQSKPVPAESPAISENQQNPVDNAPAWHTVLPTEGLPITDAQKKPGGYQQVTNVLANDAYKAITQDQKMSGMEMYAYYLPAAKGRNGIVRLVPDDQTPPAPWKLVDGQALRPHTTMKEHLVARLNGWLQSLPLMGDEKYVAPKVDTNADTPFIKAPDGSFDFGEITAEMAAAMRRQAGKIRLETGWHDQRSNEGSGLVHIEARHGKQIKDIGYASIEQFVHDSLANIGEIWKPGKTAQIVAVVSGNKGRAIFIELQPSKDGDYYTVNAAFPVSENYAKGKEKNEKWAEIWRREPVPSAAPGGQPDFASTPQDAGETPSMVRGQTSDLSVPTKDKKSNTETATANPEQAATPVIPTPATDPRHAALDKRIDALDLVEGLAAAQMLKVKHKRGDLDDIKAKLKLEHPDDLQKALDKIDGVPPAQDVESPAAKPQDVVATPPNAPLNPDQAAIDKADKDFEDALGDLGDIIGKPFRATFTPEQEQKIIPVLTRLMDAAFRKGYYKFKEAARFVLDALNAKFGKDLTDQITLDHLQGAYIGMAGRYRDQGADTAKTVVSVEDKKELEIVNGPDRRSSTHLERDSGDANPENGMGPEGVQPEQHATGGVGGRGVQGASPEVRTGSGVGLSGHEAAVAGTDGDQSIYTGAPGVSAGSAGSRVSVGSGNLGIDGPPIEPDAASATLEASFSGSEIADLKATQSKASTSTDASIADALPILNKGQQEDVAIAEARFAKEDGYGMLFTNGTGTGKTFTGLGIVKRFSNNGKENILIVAPNDKIIEDWQKTGKLFGLDLSRLDNTTDAGKGIVITTYANMGTNDALATRKWDLVVHDESHYLAMGKEGTNTNALKTLRAITMHPDGAITRGNMLHGDLIAEMNIASQNAKMARMSDDMRDWPMGEVHQKKADEAARKLEAARAIIKQEIADNQGEKRPRALMLSATPFAYEKAIDWANGYIFDYNAGRASEEGRSRGYNEGSNKDQFFVQHFGYRIRYGKLTAPDAKVDSGIMQRQFNATLKKSGALSGRMLDVKADYDRRFILVESAIGQRIDEALQWFKTKRKERMAVLNPSGNPITSMSLKPDPRTEALYSLRETIGEKFDYLSRRYLLESIKAREVIPHIREHIALGRKIVVFHDYKKGGGFNPFLISERNAKEQEATDALVSHEAWNEVVREFNNEFKDIINSDLFKQTSPIEMFQEEFPGVLLFNGDVPTKTRRSNVEKFQDDASGPQIILVQSAAGKEGISLHDTTGKHQRVLFNLGQPTAPTTAIQQEGRIYRTGQVTDAIFRYMNTGTNWEKWAFATTIATRSSTAENLGMGEQARALKDAFITGFEESGDYRAGMENEGKGGKERDKAANDALTEYDRARAFYFGQQKKTSKTKAQEGADYFATPEPIGLKMVEFADIRPGENVLEPSAGHGAIARWVPVTAERTAIEPSMGLRPRLAMVFDGKILDHDFESLHVSNKYDAIVMNPPFGSAGRTAIDHLAKASTHLRDGGRIVALIPAGPSADAKFEKWMYGEETLPIKPILTSPKAGPVFEGDILTIADSEGEWKMIAVNLDKQMSKTNSTNVDMVRGQRILRDGTAIPVSHGLSVSTLGTIASVEKTGKRTETVKSAQNIYTVADITLPAITFERAGTQARTRIVVLEKQTDNAKAPSHNSSRDYSDITDINELFDRIENVVMPTRPKEDAPEVVTKGKKEKAVVDTEAAGAAAKAMGLEIIEHTTAKGKVIRGVVRTDLTKAEAKKIDEFTFAKNGGFFIREKHLAAPNAGESPTLNDINPERWSTQHAEAATTRAIDLAIAREQGHPVTPTRKPLVLSRLKKILDGAFSGDYTEGRVVNELSFLAQSLMNVSAEKSLAPINPRTRGADFFRQKLLEAKRNGDMSAQEASFAEWLAMKNPALLDDLAISIRTAPSNSEGAGNYNPAMRMVTLFKGHASDGTAVHEVLHHLERMLPENLSTPIMREYLKRIASEMKTATGKRKQMLEAIMAANTVPSQKAVEKAVALMEGYDDYHLLNASEFWAVNGARILKARFDAKDSSFAKIKQWMLDVVQKLKSLLGMKSDASLIRALDSVLKGDGKFVAEEMLSNAKVFNDTGKAPVFFSQLSRAVESAKQGTMPAMQWRLWLNGNAGKMGIKKDEINWSGINDYLDLMGKAKVSKDEVLAYLSENGTQVKDVVLGGGVDESTYPLSLPDDWSFGDARDESYDSGIALYDTNGEFIANGETEADALEDGRSYVVRALVENSRDGETKFSQYVVPGGERYRELLITLPERKRKFSTLQVGGIWKMTDDGVPGFKDYPTQSLAQDDADLRNSAGMVDIKSSFRSSHFDQPNILTHLRMDDRTDSNGEKVLFLQEIQSDFGQAYKKQKDAIGKAVDAGFLSIVERMKKDGVLEVNCD
ncbi:DEAD/DEAH box helicase family protein [Propionivibrio sp.]|uniref:DEAD/DEAH box helicase family protein n=1 Tax=Propionivibrio sp. TaxID=2212460 RepID=UPI003BF23F7F